MTDLNRYLETLLIKIPKAALDYDRGRNAAHEKREEAIRIFEEKNNELHKIYNRERAIKIKFVLKNEEKKSKKLNYMFNNKYIKMNGHLLRLDIDKELIGTIHNVNKTIDGSKTSYNVEFKVFKSRPRYTPPGYQHEAGIWDYRENYRIEFVYDSGILTMINIFFVYDDEHYNDQGMNDEYLLQLSPEDYDVIIYSDNEFANILLESASSKLIEKTDEDSAKIILGFVGQQVKRTRTRGGKKIRKRGTKKSKSKSKNKK